MKTLCFVLLVTALCSCASWLPIAYQNAAALNSDQVLYRDVHALVLSKTNAPPVQYNPVAYAQIDGDIINATAIYNAIPKSGLSLAQLGLLSHSLAIFKNRDSLDAHPSFFQINGPLIDSTAHAIVNLETAKLIQ